MLTSLNPTSIRETAQTVLMKEGEALIELASRMNGEWGGNFEKAVKAIMDCRGCIVATGMGKAGLIARKVSATMASVGIRGFFLHPGEAFHGDLGRIGPDDLLLAFSQSGETEELTKILPFMTKNDIPVVAVTADSRSTLGSAAAAIITLGSLEEADHLNLAPSTSATAMLAIGDALAFSACKMRGFQEDDFAMFHPGGSLGRKLSLVEEYMRPLSKCRFANDEDTLRHILRHTSTLGQRCGAILLRNAAGEFSGLFTDSDLRRLIEKKNEAMFDLPISEIMAKNPKTVRVGAPMPEAVELMALYKISELPVLDDSNHLVGMLDITDIFAFVPEELYMPSSGIIGTIPFNPDSTQMNVA